MCGHLSMLTMNLLLAIQLHNGCVPACTPIHLSGRTPYLLSLVTIITSVRQETVGVLCGMVLDAEEQALAANSTNHHGSVRPYLQLPLLILK